MKKMITGRMKKAVVCMMTASMVFSTAGSVWAGEKQITQKELDELKKKLQKEIDDYRNDDEYDGNFFFSFSAPKNVMVLEEACVEECDAEYEMMETEVGFADCEAPMMVYESGSASGFLTEEYAVLKEKGFTDVRMDPLSTFAADVDTGSFCNLRRMIESGYRLDEIPTGAVRTEELLNYFDYSVEEERLSDGKFSCQYEISECPWTPEHDLLLMTVQANPLETQYCGNNFVFLLDTSGSMDEPEKIALAKCSIKLLSYTLSEEDRVSVVTYSGDSYVALESCPGNEYDKICEALDKIRPYGGTNGSGGITAAYDLAEENLMEGGNNRVFILSDGDMNLGITSTSGLVDLISKEKETGIFLTVLGFGSGNYSDTNMESIADAGNGNYFYIDCLDEAQHVLIEKQKQTTVTVAKDVKFQAEFNPAVVSGYRLIGYENREVADQDFNNDQVDGGEVGANEQVTLLYELIPAAEGKEETGNLKYQGERSLTDEAGSGEVLTLSINYKEPSDLSSQTESYVVLKEDKADEPSKDMKLAISLAELSMLIHGSDECGSTSLEEAKQYAKEAQKEGDIYRMGYEIMMDRLFESSMILR